MTVDPLDAKIVRFFTDSPRASVLEASRVLKVARATVQSRLDRMQESGVIGSWVPHPDPARFGSPVAAFCSLTINQDLGHDAVVAALSNPDLQRVLDAMLATRTVLRSSSVIVLNTHFQERTLPLLEAAAHQE